MRCNGKIAIREFRSGGFSISCLAVSLSETRRLSFRAWGIVERLTMYLRLFRHFIPVSAILLLSLDLLFIVSLLSWMRLGSIDATYSPFWAERVAANPLAPVLLIAVITMASVGLYAWEAFVDFGTLMTRIAIAFGLFVFFCYILTTYAYGQVDSSVHLINSLTVPALIWLTWVGLTRSLFAASFTLGWFKRRILVLGGGRQADLITELVRSNQNHHFIPVSYVRPTGERARHRHDSVEGSEADPSSLTELASRLGIREIVVATTERRGLPVRDLLHCKLSGIKVTQFLDFWERETRTIDLEALTPSWLFYSDGFRFGILDETLKRAFDVIVSMALLAFTLPLQMAAAGLIKLESAGPILYRQERVGRHGRVFTILKFRSMRINAEEDGRPLWAAERDSRVTRVGGFIRKYRIDELPQLVNVLRGDMSFVGPRPERPFFVDQLTQGIPYYTERHWVPPGITGWAQINCPYGASVEDGRRKLSFDLYYIKNRSIFLDFVILLRTAGVIFSRSGAR
jgi:sugar transferase (PEP-CTERM system associated)